MTETHEIRTISFDRPDDIMSVIQNRETFEIGGCQDRMKEAVLLVERAIGSEGMTSRVYTKGRTAALIPAFLNPLNAVAVVGGIVAHNLAALNPDYEIMKRPIDKVLRVSYVKDEPSLAAKAMDAAFAVGQEVVDAAKTTASLASDAAATTAAAVKDHPGAVIAGAVVGVGAPFTEGGSLLGGATLETSLAGASGIAAGAAAAVASATIADAHVDKTEQNENKKQGEAWSVLNGAIKEEAIAALKTVQSRHESEAKIVGDASVRLFDLRRFSSEHIITQVEGYINTLANTPKEFDKTFAEYRAEFQTFDEIVVQIEEEAKKVGRQAGSGAAAGVAAGVGVAAFAPTAAMAIATTFGIASTGTAISALSGVAATNAALAWLGGGALAAGGGGMAWGEAFLALAGPIGWAIGGTALVAASLFIRSHNRAIAEDAAIETQKIQVHIAALSAAKVEVDCLINLTERHVEGVISLLTQLKEQAPSDYLAFSNAHKERLGALINHVRSLSELLNKKVVA